MKTERRHDLQHNVLDNELTKVADFFRKYGNQLFWGVIIGVAIVLVVVFARNTFRRRQMEAYGRYGRLQAGVETAPAELARAWLEFAQTTHNKKLAGLALVEAGNNNLVLFLGAGAVDGQAFLAEAEELFQRVISEYADKPLAVAKAHFGLSAVAKNRREWDTARSELEAVLAIEQATSTPVTAEARAMLDQLGSLAEPVAFVSRPAITPMESLEEMYLRGEPGLDEDDDVPGEFDFIDQLP